MGQSAASNHRNLPNVTYASKQNTLAATSGFILGTAAVSNTTFVHSIVLSERSAVARTATLRVVRSGGVDDATSDIFQAVALASTEVLQIDFAEPGLILNAGDSLKGLASAATAVNYVVNYSTER